MENFSELTTLLEQGATPINRSQSDEISNSDTSNSNQSVDRGSDQTNELREEIVDDINDENQDLNIVIDDCRESNNETQPLSDKEAESRFISWYEEICKERLTMLETEENFKNKIKELEEAETSYIKRIKELDENSIALVQAFKEAQTETKMLRRKYEPDENNETGYKEPYNDVLRDRDRLIKVELEYKRRMKNLEEELETLRNYVKDMNNSDNTTQNISEHNRIVAKSVPKVDRLVVITGEEYITKLEKENLQLKNKLDKLEHEKFLHEMSKTDIIHSKFRSVHSLKTMKQDAIFDKQTGKYHFRKNFSLPSLPHIASSSSRSSEVERSRSLTPSHSGLNFGLSYHEIHARKLRQQKPDKSYPDISKYII
ncbi:hypothetical protein ACF0H5_000333 [Mactra antiquata]